MTFDDKAVSNIAYDVCNDLGARWPHSVRVMEILTKTVRHTIEDVESTDIISLDRYIDYVMDNETHDYVIYYWDIVQSFAHYQLWGTDYEDRNRGQANDMITDMMLMVNEFYSDVVIETAHRVWDDIKEEEE